MNALSAFAALWRRQLPWLWAFAREPTALDVGQSVRKGCKTNHPTVLDTARRAFVPTERETMSNFSLGKLTRNIRRYEGPEVDG